ncbi:ribokinase [Actinomycetospora lemnae]|uniref:Ribokinase n=1 Tax=Actinomycetospora lemnae TaxID=3019891 RepID=A0ABT5SXP5_9PSEU|nr:ribokinase [Actinomycetospora sp. DW7H6]MDD7967633.1 ribokinase [Actinomycetospora sp. DW7H6]
MSRPAERPTEGLPPRVTVVGSVNLDLVARVDRLPAPGETLTAHGVTRVPGGKGANQALAAARLGGRVRLVAAVGDDPLAGEALTLLRAGGVDLAGVRISDDAPTGTAMIQVDDDGETTIVIDAGANATLAVTPDELDADVVLTVLEVPDETVATAMAASAFTVLNAAPARPVAGDVLAGLDLLCVNAAEYGELAAHADLDDVVAVAITHGAAGAELRRRGRVVAQVEPPPVDAVDGTAAGDAFTAALALGLATGLDDEAALRRACRAGALAATRAGAQPSLPTRDEVDVP